MSIVKCSMLNVNCQMFNAKCQLLDAKCQMFNAKCQVPVDACNFKPFWIEDTVESWIIFKCKFSSHSQSQYHVFYQLLQKNHFQFKDSSTNIICVIWHRMAWFEQKSIYKYLYRELEQYFVLCDVSKLRNRLCWWWNVVYLL